MKVAGRATCARRLALGAAGIAMGLGLAEAALRAFDLPRRYRTHSAPPQFGLLGGVGGGSPVYVNKPSCRIRIRYDGNPRGYFGPRHEVDHFVNAAGFRGGEFHADKPAGTLRLAFLGDSFTFGEGVRFEDTYPEVAADTLEREAGAGGRPVESLNFAVGGYNAVQSLEALRQWVLPCRPDAVVLGYVLNDPEEPLFHRDPVTGRIERRAREVDALEGESDPMPPAGAWSALRIGQVSWRWRHARERNRQLVAHYRALHAEANPAWRATRAALGEMARLCRAHGVPFYVACFPILLPGRGYPLADVHRRVGEAVTAAGGRFVDLRETLGRLPATRLWVHPTDPHPNEAAHRMTGTELAGRLEADGVGKEGEEEEEAQRTQRSGEGKKNEVGGGR